MPLEAFARQIGELVAEQRALHRDVTDIKGEVRDIRKDLKGVSDMAKEHRTGIRTIAAAGAGILTLLSYIKGWWPFGH